MAAYASGAGPRGTPDGTERDRGGVGEHETKPLPSRKTQASARTLATCSARPSVHRLTVGVGVGGGGVVGAAYDGWLC